MRALTAGAARRAALAAWVAPALLCGVALAQLAMARWHTLSPWKGGGFGMFSTVDSPGARFLRIRLTSGEREVPVLIPDRLRPTAHELRTTGSRALALRLAYSLSAGTWVELRLASALRYYQRLLQGARPASQDEWTAALARLTSGPQSVIDLGSRDFLRLLEPSERPADGDVVVVPERVCVELWRYSFDAGGRTLQARRLLDPPSCSSR